MLFSHSFLHFLSTFAFVTEAAPADNKDLISGILSGLPSALFPTKPKKECAFPKPGIPTQPPVQQNSQNTCTTGTPYCCSGDGPNMSCGPSSSTSCNTLMICCINTNGMQICAGEINFTGPVTMYFNNNIGCRGKHKRFD